MQQSITQLNDKIKQLEMKIDQTSQISQSLSTPALQSPTKTNLISKMVLLQQTNDKKTLLTKRQATIIQADSFETTTTTTAIDTNIDNVIEMAPTYETFNSLDRNPILDNAASKFKSVLIKRGSLASRQLPNQPTRDLFDIVNDLKNNENEQNSVHDDSLEKNNQHDVDENNFEGFNSGLLAYRQQNTSNNLVFSPNNINSSPQMYHQQQQKYNSYVVNSFTSPIEDWTGDQVAQWLVINDMSMYADGFLKNSIDGEKLVGLDNSKLKVCCTGKFVVFF
jgi:hypothetical protein